MIMTCEASVGCYVMLETGFETKGIIGIRVKGGGRLDFDIEIGIGIGIELYVFVFVNFVIVT